MSVSKPVSARVMLRSFQMLHRDGLDPGFMADVEQLRHQDLDLSVKFGALLTFDALIIAAGMLPMTASPGAPLSVDLATDPLIVATALIGVALLASSAFFSVRGVMIGEEFDAGGMDDPAAVARRLFAAYCAAIDAQIAMLRRAAQLTIAGGGVVAVGLVWALVDKWVGWLVMTR